MTAAKISPPRYAAITASQITTNSMVIRPLAAALLVATLAVIAAYLGGLIFAAVKSYGGNYFKLPVIGNMAEKFANK